VTPTPSDPAEPLAPDDLIALARAGWRLGAQHCTACGGYHRMWGALRAAGVVGGADADEAVLAPLLTRALTPGARVLLAGSADPGILDMVARAAGATPLQVLVADICATPLKVIEALRPYPAIQVETLRLDLTTLDHEAAWDVIVSHSMLPFVGPEARLEILTRLRRALAPGGRLLLAMRSASAMEDADAARHDEAWIARAKAKIARSGIPLPGPADAFDAALTRYAALRPARLWATTPEQVEDLLRSVGFRQVETFRSQESSALTIGDRTYAKRGYILEAR